MSRRGFILETRDGDEYYRGWLAAVLKTGPVEPGEFERGFNHATAIGSGALAHLAELIDHGVVKVLPFESAERPDPDD